MANIPSVFFLLVILVTSNFVYSSPVPQFGFVEAVGGFSNGIAGLLGGSGAPAGGAPGGGLGGAPGGGGLGGAPGGGGLGGAPGGIGALTG